MSIETANDPSSCDQVKSSLLQMPQEILALIIRKVMLSSAGQEVNEAHSFYCSCHAVRSLFLPLIITAVLDCNEMAQSNTSSKAPLDVLADIDGDRDDALLKDEGVFQITYHFPRHAIPLRLHVILPSLQHYPENLSRIFLAAVNKAFLSSIVELELCSERDLSSLDACSIVTACPSLVKMELCLYHNSTLRFIQPL
ncbi:hypothetical protein CEUSTIGMA_g11696.t1 [Chlamydomonas eustigma]|uniref:Uncharacterized protein n=1 Tax=Chlamydomonas eustigma TaxID=1157962 RepID=A0A250XMM1_9CHLO|nr:hypothetical protein CEUSTIGMA_g11696.t1 [Chlamydomonas eustigma]|eukprot:GAX84273.1 hypothetical protein CEUSTIGMA_g11696.t1 [Chlamydomonas eustigma]